jgi:hypothetical protein
MEAICSSETSVDLQRTKWQYIPEDIGLFLGGSAQVVMSDAHLLQIQNSLQTDDTGADAEVLKRKLLRLSFR